jgi:hypothetical protein
MPQYPLQGSIAPQGVAVPRSNNQGVPYANAYGRIGSTWYVDYTNGLDTNNGGPLAPFKNFSTAYAAAVAGDTIFVVGTVTITATQTLSKNNIAIIGLNSPSQNSRARFSASGTVFTPMFNVTGQGNRFENIGTFYGFDSATAQVCWAETGGRNYYKNILFGGGGHATAAAQAGMRSLTIAGEGENVFEDCTFGLDTVARATNANATLEFLGGVQRNKFIRPIFQMLSSIAGNIHIKAAASAVDRSQYMFEPIFENAVDSTATTISVAITWDAAAGGNLILQGTPISVGATKIAAAGPVYVSGPAAPAGATTGLAVKAV